MKSKKTYKLYTDGACSGNPGRIGIGCVIYDEHNNMVCSISEEKESGTNNEAEYLAMVAGLKAVVKFEPKTVFVHSDSQLIINQINGLWKVKQSHLLLLYNQVFQILNNNKNIDFNFKWVRRQFNKVADHLASSAINQSQGVFIDGEFIEWNEVATMGNIIEIDKLPKVKENCLISIKQANCNDADLRFGDFINLKSGGRDEYSCLSENELFNIISIRFGEEVVFWLEKALESSEERFKQDAIRWTARGLYPNLALKKAAVNREMEDKKKNKIY